MRNPCLVRVGLVLNDGGLVLAVPVCQYTVYYYLPTRGDDEALSRLSSPTQFRSISWHSSMVLRIIVATASAVPGLTSKM